VVTRAIRREKLQSKCHYQPANQQLQAGCPSCRPNNSVKALKDFVTGISVALKHPVLRKFVEDLGLISVLTVEHCSLVSE